MESEPESEPQIEETRLNPLAFMEPPRSRPRITWTDAAGLHTVVIDGKVIIGSAPGSGVVIADPTVSRLHAEFEARDDGWWLRDLGSKNGSFIDGLQILGARVPDRARLRLGSTDIAVEYISSQARPVALWATATFGKLVGRSVPMRELFATLARLAPMDASVLVSGETGTGKELVARAIHDASPRASKPFVVVDCAALPENLLDAELFGHTRGAFTGAHAAREGAIESAEGGTVFLDEIGELPMSMQPKLLRVLESHTVRRLGETAHRPVDVRFLSATHRDLLTMVNAGEFREDLYFRLSVLPLNVPSLRDRKDDIELLVSHFLRSAGAQPQVSSELLRELVARSWRGNVRELRNFVERARALGATEALAMTSQHPTARAQTSGKSEPPAVATEPPRASSSAPPRAQNAGVALAADGVFAQAYKDFRESWIDAGEREYVRRLLEKHNRNVAAAAREAEVDRTYIYRLIRKHEL